MWTKLTFIAAVIVSAVTGSCPPDFDDFGLNDNICYQIDSDSQTWTTSFTSCLTANEGSNLVTIKSKEEFFALVFYVRQGGVDVWTGLINIHGSKSWADGTPYSSDLDDFFSNDTDTGIYGYISAEDGLFHTDDGTVQHGRVCYVDVTPPATTTPQVTTTEPSTTPAPPPCDDSWQQYGETCYYFSTEPQYWASAGHSCHTLDAEPVSIHDSGVLTFLLLQAQQGVYWIGLAGQNDTFVYEDGTDSGDVEQILGQYLDEWEEGADCLSIDPAGFPEVISYKSCFEKLPYTCYKQAREGSSAFYPEWAYEF